MRYLNSVLLGGSLLLSAVAGPANATEDPPLPTPRAECQSGYAGPGGSAYAGPGGPFVCTCANSAEK
jgi:hypothetical protein